MREVKFRGKDGQGVWRYGNYARSQTGMHTIELYQQGVGISLFFVEPETIGQFTGLKDKNGTEIYEGDVYTTGDDSAYIVVFENGAFCGNYGEGSKPLDWDYDYAEGDLCPDQFSQQIKVIGNIHDNPALLEA